MTSVAQHFNMIDGTPKKPVTKNYRLVVWYSVTVAEDIDIVEEGIDREATFDTVGEALTEIADVVSRNGDFDLWDEIDGRLNSYWLPYQNYCNAGDGEGYDISFTAMVESATVKNLWRSHRGYSQHFGRAISEREVNLTLRRVKVFR